nr:MAG TPA: hypothetical protein [Caudoviricetes sp.]
MRKSNGFSARQLTNSDLHPLLCGVALIFASAFQECNILVDLINLFLTQVFRILYAGSYCTAFCFRSRLINISSSRHQILIGHTERGRYGAKNLRRSLFSKTVFYSLHFGMANSGKFCKPPY